MNEQTAEENELSGLSAAISEAFLAHPAWKRLEDGVTVVCAGPECGWKKPTGKGPKQAWLKHQTFTMRMAVAGWYFNESERTSSAEEDVA